MICILSWHTVVLISTQGIIAKEVDQDGYVWTATE